MTAASPLVLRGRGDAVLRFTGAAVVLGRADGEHHIPLEAIESVHPEGRSVEIELIALADAEPAVYRVEDVSEAAATAFADAVEAALPDEVVDVDGSALVTHRPPAAPAPRDHRTKLLAAGIAVPVVALDVFLGVAGRLEYALTFWIAFVVTAIGGLLAGDMGRDLYRMWRLPRYGITVTAEVMAQGVRELGVPLQGHHGSPPHLQDPFGPRVEGVVLRPPRPEGGHPSRGRPRTLRDGVHHAPRLRHGGRRALRDRLAGPRSPQGLSADDDPA
ncbi:hypothetical protein [Streptomyces cinereoruber]|uniref:hypothetical protein n=1 Tax=Streptomyces cinereoruber TaxID=67260 RepID=UPI00362F3A06